MGKTTVNIPNKLNTIRNSINNSLGEDLPLAGWRNRLSQECQVYVCGENYIAKRFDQINYKFCSREEAKEVAIDNCYALLRYKFFTVSTDDVDEKIKEIVNSFVQNLKTSLIKVSFENDTDCMRIKMLPDGCVAFKNGVFNFRTNQWLFKYDILKITALQNTIYMYDPSYVIFWYVNLNFQPLPCGINDFDLNSFISLAKEYDKESKNYCFELMWNISHDINDMFSMKNFVHLCEILGYCCLQSFSQNFVMLIGSGQNGKNSLFDGCFTGKIVPRPAANDLDAIENDRFITGSLENKAHNIFLESSAKTYTESKMLKAITGSMYQTIEPKGITKYSGLINCKFVFAANDQDKIKFSDNTTGFRRRINMFEIFYHWDPEKKYLRRNKDYYDTSFSDSLSEIKEDDFNTVFFIYFAMYGIQSATADFTRNFKFTYNDWKLKYSDVDITIKDTIDRITLNDIYNYLKNKNKEASKYIMYDSDGKVLYYNDDIKYMGYNNNIELIDFFANEEDSTKFFSDNDFYLNIGCLREIIGSKELSTQFTNNLKKAYGFKANDIKKFYNNQSYVKCRFISGHFKIIGND